MFYFLEFCFVRCFVFDFLYKDLTQRYDSTTSVFRSIFSFEHPIKKSFKKWIFDSFWQDLGFRASFFRSKFELKK